MAHTNGDAHCLFRESCFISAREPLFLFQSLERSIWFAGGRSHRRQLADRPLHPKPSYPHAARGHSPENTACQFLFFVIDQEGVEGTSIRPGGCCGGGGGANIPEERCRIWSLGWGKKNWFKDEFLQEWVLKIAPHTHEGKRLNRYGSAGRDGTAERQLLSNAGKSHFRYRHFWSNFYSIRSVLAFFLKLS